jgi:hypothetical protein
MSHQPEKTPAPDAPGTNGTASAGPSGRTGLRGFRIGWTLFLVLLTSVPYLANWRETPPGRHYTWILPPYPEDSFAYQAWAQQAAQGSLLFRDKYTALPHAPFLFHPFFLASGWICALTGAEPGMVFLVLKAVGVVVFFALFFRYLDYLGLNQVQSVSASLLAGVSSGFGGLIMLSGLGSRWPLPLVDLRLPDVDTFWSLLWNPLFPYSLAILVLAMHRLDRGTREDRMSDGWRAGLATGLLALLHPYSQPLVLACAVVLALARRGNRATGFLARYFCAAGPFLLYLVLMTVFDPLVSRHGVQGEMKSPALAAYVYAFGLPLLLAGAGMVLGRENLLRRWWPVVLWFTLAVALAYLPLWFQRKLVFGSQLPLCILAGVSVGVILERFPGRAARTLILAAGLVIGLPLASSTSAYLLASERREVARNADGAYYLADDLMAGLKYLKQRSRPEDVVCATMDTSRVIPAVSGNTVLWGHWAMTVDNPERQAWFERLFGASADPNDTRRAGEFWDRGIRYIFADGGLKQSLEQNPQMWRLILDQADEVYTNRLVVIYERRGGR